MSQFEFEVGDLVMVGEDPDCPELIILVTGLYPVTNTFAGEVMEGGCDPFYTAGHHDDSWAPQFFTKLPDKFEQFTIALNKLEAKWNI